MKQVHLNQYSYVRAAEPPRRPSAFIYHYDLDLNFIYDKYLYMQNFDQIIEQYATKVIDKDNQSIVKYVLKAPYRKRNISLLDEHQPNSTYSKSVRTPNGVFYSLRSAAVGNKIATATLYKYLQEQREGYEYL